MATFFFNQGATNGGSGSSAFPFNQRALNAAIAAGTFTSGGADDISFQAGGTGVLVLTASQASSTPIRNVSGGPLTVQISQAVLDNSTILDLTELVSPAPAASLALVNVNGGNSFAINTNSVLRLNADQARTLATFGTGTVSVANIQSTALNLAGDYSNLRASTVTATVALTAGVTFTGNLGKADLTITSASAQTFIVNNPLFLNTFASGNPGSVTVGDNVTFATTAGSLEDLNDRVIATTGSGQITIRTMPANDISLDADLSRLTGNIVWNQTLSTRMANGVNFGTVQPTIASGATLTLADDQQNDLNSTQFNGNGNFSYTRTAAYTGAGDDIKIFTTGRNVYNSSAAGATPHNVVAGAGRDLISTAGGADTIRGGKASDTINAGVGNDFVYGGAGPDQITVAGNDFVEGGGGNDTIDGTGGGSHYITDSTGNDQITTGGGFDTILSGKNGDTIISGAGNDSIAAGAGPDVITAGNNNDTIIGGGGNDTINMGAGSDSADGGNGDDIFQITATGDQIDGDTIDGGTGTDSISIVQAAAAIGSVFDMDDISNVLSISTANNGAAAAGGGNDITATFVAIAETTAQTVAVSAASITTADVDLVVTNNANSATTTFNITGGAGADTLAGSNGADTISGGAGANVITGGQGADTLTGGGAVDTFQVTGTSDQVAADSIDGAGGADVVLFNSGGGAIVAEFDMDNISNLLLFQNGTAGGNRNITFSSIQETTTQTVVADFNSTTSSASVVIINNAASTTTRFNMAGGDAADTLVGSNANDTLRGGRAADNLTGGNGNDIFQVAFDAAGFEQVTGDTISGGAGTNRFDLVTGGGAITATIDLDFVDGVTNFQTTGTGLGGANNTFAFAGVTEPTAQVISVDGSSVTTATADLVVTQTGTPATTRFSLVGGGGVDILAGSAGADTFTGGIGIDRLTGGAGNDNFIFSSGLTLTNDRDVINDGSSTDNYQINTSTGNALVAPFTAFVSANGNPLAATADGATTNSVLATAVDVSTAGPVTIDANATVIQFTQAGGAGFANGFGGLIAAQHPAFDLNEFGGGDFTTGNQLVAVVEDTANNQIDVGSVTIVDIGGGVGQIRAIGVTHVIDITGGITASQVAAAVDFIGLA